MKLLGEVIISDSSLSLFKTLCTTLYYFIKLKTTFENKYINQLNLVNEDHCNIWRHHRGCLV